MQLVLNERRITEICLGHSTHNFDSFEKLHNGEIEQNHLFYEA
jgi:hypothetical protein